MLAGMFSVPTVALPYMHDRRGGRQLAQRCNCVLTGICLFDPAF